MATTMATSRRKPFRASTVLRVSPTAGSDIEPNARVESAHVGFMRGWAGTVNGIQRAQWPTIRKLIESEQKRLGTRTDGVRLDQLPKTIPALTALIRDMVKEYTAGVEADEKKSDDRVEGIERALESTSSTAWADNIESKVRKTRGVTASEKIDISEFLIGEEPDIPRRVRRSWIREQLGLISGKPVAPVRVAGKLIETISGRSMKRLRTIVTKGILRGTRVESIMAELAELPGMTKRHAELIARDQVVKQNGRMTRIRHEGIGVTHYTWQTVGDQRVRDSHKARQGKRYSYKNGPPGGLNPGLEIQCRCWSSPDLLGAVRSLRRKKARGDSLSPRPSRRAGRVPGLQLDTMHRLAAAPRAQQSSGASACQDPAHLATRFPI